MARSVRRRSASADRSAADRRDAGAGPRDRFSAPVARPHDPRRRHRHRPRGAAAGRARRAGHRRRRVGGDARGRRAPRQRPRASTVTFAEGDAHALDFPIASFDAVVCLRVLMHTPDWRRSLAELCRVARERVVFDYPALSSAAALQAVTRHVAHALGARSRPTGCSLAGRSQIALARERFPAPRQCTASSCCRSRCTSDRNSGPATERIEGGLRRAGLTRLLGSPVTLVAERCAS